MPFSPKRVGSVAYSLVMFVVVSVLSGVLIAGLFVPVAGIAGASSKAAADELDKIEAALATPIPATRSRVLMADGKLLAYFYDENRIYVGLNKIAPIMRQAIVAIEDHRFYEHGALDIKGTLRALVRNTSGDGNTQGGSSITQQYVKMTLVEACRGDKGCVDDATAPTLTRKIRELRYAIALEKRLTKNQILERYLNIAYYGDGAYGIESAARHYYNKKASRADPERGHDARRPRAEPARQQPDDQHDRGAGPPRRGGEPDGGAEVDHAGAGQAGEGVAVRHRPGEADPQRLRRNPVPVPVRLRVPEPAERAEPRSDPRRS